MYKKNKYGINIDKHDQEGRVLTLEFEKFYIISCYTPNSGENLKRLDYRVEEWDKDFFEYINDLKSKKDIILAGDLNVAKDDIDIYEVKGHVYLYLHFLAMLYILILHLSFLIFRLAHCYHIVNSMD